MHVERAHDENLAKVSLISLEHRCNRVLFFNDVLGWIIKPSQRLSIWDSQFITLKCKACYCVYPLTSCKVKFKVYTISIQIEDLECCWAVWTLSPYSTSRAPSTLLIFEGSRILGCPGPLVNSFWVSDFNELDFIIYLLFFYFFAVFSSQNCD